MSLTARTTRRERHSFLAAILALALLLGACTDSMGRLSETTTAAVRFAIDLPTTQSTEDLVSGAVETGDVVTQGIVQLVLSSVDLRVFEGATELKFDSAGNVDMTNGTSPVQLYDGTAVQDVTLKVPVNHTYAFDLSVTSPDDANAATISEAAFAREIVSITGPTTVGFPSLRSLVEAIGLDAGGTEIAANSTRGIYLNVTGIGSASTGVAPSVPYSDFSVSYAATGATVDTGSRRGAVITHDGTSTSVSVTATVNAAGADRSVQNFITTIELAVVEETADVNLAVDLQAPTTSISNPLSGSTLTTGATTTVSGTATDTGLLSSVTLYDDLLEVGNASLSQPDEVNDPDLWNWSISWTPTIIGTRQLYAVATDSSGNQGEHSITVEVVEGPSSTWYRDADLDTYGDPNVPTTASTAPAGYVADNTDCDDTSASINPSATEVADGVDNDCDGLVDEGLAAHDVLLVDSAVTYNGITTPITIYTDGLSTMPSAVSITPTGTSDAPLSLAFAVDVNNPNRISAIVPAGLSAGTYDVTVSDSNEAPATATGALMVTQSLTGAAFSAGPAAVSNLSTAQLALAIDGSATGTTFNGNPSVYAAQSTATGAATRLEYPTLIDGTQLTAVVPSGLPQGVYDLVVVDSDGSVHVTAAALSVSANPAPMIATLSHERLVSGFDNSLTISGANFLSPTVDLACNNGIPIAGTILASTSSSIDASFALESVGSGVACSVTVVNGDGISYTYSAVSAISGEDVGGWTAETSLNIARRAPALVTGTLPATRHFEGASPSRYLHALGGDSGSAIGAMASVESAPVDVFGVPGNWSMERNALTSARTLAGAARVGRFIYLVGGNDGANTVGNIDRAEVLDPAAAPVLHTYLPSVSSGAGLSGGTWHYAVSATYGLLDANNPSGESLPGDTLAVTIPSSGALDVTVTWDAASNAAGYRIYRSPAADAGAHTLELLAEVSSSATSFTDSGGSTTASTRPLPLGSLGTWHSVASLGTAREALAVVAAPTTGGAFLYALGGKDGAGTHLGTYEYATIAVDSSGDQSVGTLQTDTDTFVPRSSLGAWLLAGDGSVPTTIYVGVGEDSAGAENSIHATRVSSTGDLDAFTDTGASAPGRSFAGAVYAHNRSDMLYIFGGGHPPASSGYAIPADTMLLSTGQWEISPHQLIVSASYPGYAQDSAFAFVAGGFDGTQAIMVTQRTTR